MRILVIDDENRTRESIIRLIKQLGPEFKIVGEAADGYNGMLLIRELSPDVVITDIMMPRVSGLEMIANVGMSSPRTRFLILSGYAEFELAQQALKLSAVDYLLKPITAEQMRTALFSLREKVLGHPDNLAKPAGEKKYSDITLRIIHEIEENFFQRLYLDVLAQKIGITPEYAGNVFFKETGKSFNIYLRDLRMEKAKELLKTTQNKIYEIAYKTGYADVKYFCRVFKEYTGVSAKHYLMSLK
ncbi:DNA-binding response regulator [Spirochaetia bacterium]|nr:DNA-binding response regulator [Spirochaetia bacterium]